MRAAALGKSAFEQIVEKIKAYEIMTLPRGGAVLGHCEHVQAKFRCALVPYHARLQGRGAVIAPRPLAECQLIVSTSTLLLPPLLQPRSEEFPLGVSTLTLTDPGPEMRPDVSVTFSCVLLTTVVLSAVPLSSTSEAETN